MKSIVYNLARHFYFVRVDLYNLNGRVYFGEITFHPGSGYRKFRPKEQDRILSDKLTIRNHSTNESLVCRTDN
jgi:hypothetical protein